MTTICWDGKTLATDSRVVDGNDVIIAERCKKLFRVGEKWIATSGTCQDTEAALLWFKDGEPRDRKPELGEFRALVKVGARCFRYEEGLFAVECVALAAMACGKSAIEAIRIAAKFNTTTNSRVQATP